MLTGILFLGAEELLDLVANFTIRDLDVIFGGAIIRHQIELPFECHASDQPHRHFGEGVNENHDATPAGMMPLQMNLLP